MKTKLNSKAVSTVVDAFAEAWRNLQMAENAMKEVKDAFRDVLASGPVEYTYADGATVDFKLVEGHRVNPVDFATAKEITGFGDALMARIAGSVDPKKVRAMVEIGKIPAEKEDILLPEASYLQIRGTFRKD